MNKIEEKYGLKTGQAVILLVLFVLNVVWIVTSTVSRIRVSGSLPFNQIVNIVMFAVTIYYVCYSYKKPHGNLMRYLILSSAVFSAVKSIISTAEYPIYLCATNYLMIILKSYMAGRLDHYKQNIVTSMLILACYCVAAFYYISICIQIGRLNFVSVMSCLGSITIWLAIAASYIIRYKPHKDAGLEEK